MKRAGLSFLFFILITNQLFAQESRLLFNKNKVLAFIDKWDEINLSINEYRAKNPKDKYFQKIENFIFSLTDLTIFVIGYSDQQLDKTVNSHLKMFNEIINYHTPRGLQKIFKKHGIEDGEKFYFELLIASILIGIEKRAMFEENNPNNYLEIEPILRNTRAHFKIFNDDDLNLIRDIFNTLPKEINWYYYNIE